MTKTDLKRLNKRKLATAGEKTVITSINGKPIEEVCPGLDNRFDNFAEAFNTVAKLLNNRLFSMKTKRQSFFRKDL